MRGRPAGVDDLDKAGWEKDHDIMMRCGLLCVAINQSVGPEVIALLNADRSEHVVAEAPDSRVLLTPRPKPRLLACPDKTVSH